MPVRVKKNAFPPWFKQRFYLHFDRPVSLKKATEIVLNPSIVAKHAFMPFIRFEQRVKRYKREKGIVEEKKRPISFAYHLDSAIYSYYSFQLAQLFEKQVRDAGLSDAILAYRKFPGGKCNIDFADEVFEKIRGRGPCTAIAFDVEKFFDKMDHQI